jgi:hypothetical protein
VGGKDLLAFGLAYLFGIIFQYFSVAPMRGLGIGEGVVEAIKVDTLSLLAYEIGMFAWMGFRTWLYPELDPVQWSYWLMMQVAMVLGFATTYPVNWWLISRGSKEKMRAYGPARFTRSARWRRCPSQTGDLSPARWDRCAASLGIGGGGYAPDDVVPAAQRHHLAAASADHLAEFRRNTVQILDRPFDQICQAVRPIAAFGDIGPIVGAPAQ